MESLFPKVQSEFRIFQTAEIRKQLALGWLIASGFLFVFSLSLVFLLDNVLEPVIVILSIFVPIQIILIWIYIHNNKLVRKYKPKKEEYLQTLLSEQKSKTANYFNQLNNDLTS